MSCRPHYSTCLLLRFIQLLKLLSEPAIQLGVHIFRHIGESKSGTISSVNPGHMHLRLKRSAGARQSEHYPRNTTLRQVAAKIDGHSTFAQVRRSRFEFLFAEDKRHRHLHRLAEIAPPFAEHEIDCSTEAAHRIDSRQGLLQRKIRAQFERLIGGRWPLRM